MRLSLLQATDAMSKDEHVRRVIIDQSDMYTNVFSVFEDNNVSYTHIKTVMLINYLSFLAPLAQGQQAIVMALCLSCIRLFACACVCPSINSSFKKLLLRNY